MAKQMMKSFGGFNAIGDVVQINLPGGAIPVALRLYDEGMEIAEWAIFDTDAPSAPGTQRFFVLTDTSVLPDNFVKFVGALLFGLAKVPALVIEVTEIPAEKQARIAETKPAA